MQRNRSATSPCHFEPIGGKKLLVTFSNNPKKIYDCTALLREEAFKPLLANTLFQSVVIDPESDMIGLHSMQ
jgi:hypothetical protein